MSDCPNCGYAFMFGCICTDEEIKQGYANQDFWYRTKNLKPEDMERIYKIIKNGKLKEIN